MKRMLAIGLLTATGVAALFLQPAEARGFFGGPRVGFGFGFGIGVPGCWGCAYYPPYPPYGPYYGPYYGPAWYPPNYYGPPYPAYPPPPYYQSNAAPPPPPPGNARVTRRQGETDYELPDSVLFALDSSVISRDAGQVLNVIADAAKDQPGATLVVEGHTDTSGDRAHNRKLSGARARAVADVLVREGVSRARIRTEGLGETGLAVQTGNGVREARNRRVVIRLMENGRTLNSVDRDDDGPSRNDR